MTRSPVHSNRDVATAVPLFRPPLNVVGSVFFIAQVLYGVAVIAFGSAGRGLFNDNGVSEVIQILYCGVPLAVLYCDLANACVGQLPVPLRPFHRIRSNLLAVAISLLAAFVFFLYAGQPPFFPYLFTIGTATNAFFSGFLGYVALVYAIAAVCQVKHLGGREERVTGALGPQPWSMNEGRPASKGRLMRYLEGAWNALMRGGSWRARSGRRNDLELVVPQLNLTHASSSIKALLPDKFQMSGQIWPQYSLSARSKLQPEI